MAPDAPEREPEMQDTPPCHRPISARDILNDGSGLCFSRVLLKKQEKSFVIT